MHDAARHPAAAPARPSSARRASAEIDVPASAQTAGRPYARMVLMMWREDARRGGTARRRTSAALLQLAVAVDELEVLAEGGDPPPPALVPLQLEVVAAHEHARVP